MEIPDPPSDTPGASKKVFLTPHDIPRILRAHGESVTFSRSPGAAGAANAAASRNQLEAALVPWDFFPGGGEVGKMGDLL